MILAITRDQDRKLRVPAYIIMTRTQSAELGAMTMTTVGESFVALSGFIYNRQSFTSHPHRVHYKGDQG